jgi:hypothetical protein
MTNRNRLPLAIGAAAAALAVAGFVVWRSSQSSDGDTQSNVAQFAKSIDGNKRDTPSVPPERLKLGVSGPRARGH